jgi:hypothetical protein
MGPDGIGMPSRLMDLARRLACAIPVMLIGMFLLLDATTFGLRPVDRASNRARGCYVVLDDIIGAKEPTEWARPIELAVASVFILASSTMVFRGLWTARSRKSPHREDEGVRSQ